MNKNRILVLLMVIGLIALGSFGYLWFQKQNSSSTVSAPSKPNSTEESKLSNEINENSSKVEYYQIPAEDSRPGLAVDFVPATDQSLIKSDEIQENLSFNSVTLDSSKLNLCQPTDFDLNNLNFKPIELPNFSPSKLYEITNPTDPDKNTFQIDGWMIEGEDKLLLPAPLTARKFVFGCASQFDRVLEIKSEGKPYFYISKVVSPINQKSLSKDGKYLFLSYYKSLNESESNSLFSLKYQIIDLAKNQTYELPQLPCVSNQNYIWQGSNLLTIAQFNESSGSDQSQICIWNTEGKLESIFSAKLYWSMASSASLNSKVFYKDSILSIYHQTSEGYEPGKNCNLISYNVADKSLSEALVGQSDQNGNCPKIELKSLEKSRAVLFFET